MKTLAALFAVLSVSWFAAPAAQAADPVATLRGIVKDSRGQPLQGAEIRISGRDVSKVGKAHTDASGHYSYPGLETGLYNVTLVVDGSVRASINNVKTRLGEVQSLNFELQSGASARPFAKGRHYVWIPATTGTHLGRWVEVNDDVTSISTGMQERLANQGNSIVKDMTDQHPPTMGHH